MNHRSCLKSFLLSLLLLSIANQIISQNTSRVHSTHDFSKVIDRYSKNPADSLKKKAAQFLIKNIDPHYSYYSKNWDALCSALSSGYLYSKDKSDYIDCYDSIFNAFDSGLNDYVLKYDKDTINDEFLISNVENSFKAYRLAQNKKVSFTDFCEYVLPYKIGCDKPTNWRTYYYNKFSPLYNEIYKRKRDSAAYYFCDTLKNYFKVQIHSHYPTPDIDAITLERLKVGTCFEFSRLIAYVCASVGIPVTIDLTPQWGRKTGSHEWNVLISGDKPLDFGAGDNDKLGYHLKSNEKSKSWLAPKIYRQTYSINKSGLAYIHGDEEIPDFFTDTCLIDVTSKYYKTSSIEIDFPNTSSGKRFAYLAVSNINEWTPVAWTQIENNKAKFNDLNTNIVYLPCNYIFKTILPISYPIIQKDSSTTIVLKPDTNNVRDIKLYRKFYNPNVAHYNRRLKDSKFQVASKADFSDAKEILTIGSIYNNNYQTTQVNGLSNCKYFRYLIPKGYGSEMAEIELYDSLNNSINGKTISNRDCKNPEAVFDKNTLTYMKVDRSNDTWVGLEFNHPITIKKIKYLPRNDDNFIREGEQYELFYWNYGWLSLGKKKGDDKQYLEYNNAPANALFLLRNLTKGHEERIFTYENNKQVWW